MAVCVLTAVLAFGGRAFCAEEVPDAQKAKTYLEAAKAGNHEAQFLLGKLYLEGQGMARDPAEALRWFAKSAAQGFPPAFESLGLMYMLGVGTPKNPSKAASWLQKAAQFGRPDSMAFLSRLVLMGEGTAADPAKALFWAEAGLRRPNISAPAKTLMTEVKRKAASALPPAKQREIAAQAAGFRPKSFQRENRLGEATGTGFIISKAGYAITNRHVVNGCRTVAARYKGAYYPLKVKNISSNSDLAMLSFGRQLPGSFTIRSDPARQGEKLVIMGYPLDRAARNDPLLTTGRVTGTSGNGGDITFTADGVTFGSSGSAILDGAGMVVGVLWGGRSGTKAGGAVVFALPSDELGSFLKANNVPFATRASYGDRDVKALGKEIRDMVVPIYCQKEMAP